MRKANWKSHKGRTVKDKVTGFCGVVVAHISYLTGCDQYCVQPPTKEDGSWVDSRYFDVNRLDLCEGDAKQVSKGAENGCDIAPPSI